MEEKPLSQYGIGPYYGGLVFLLTFGALLLNYFHILPVLCVWTLPLRLLGTAFLLGAGVLWFHAVFTTNIVRHIRQNELVTSGAYAWVRNPIYSAIMLAMWGLLLWSGNLLLLVLCPIYPLLMTILVKATEEKWLAQRHGKAYLDYCKRVNRCFPWPPKWKGER